jgi:4-amino-4-deoxy-L-arabinose transferase-like glycosyltransferase
MARWIPPIHQHPVGVALAIALFRVFLSAYWGLTLPPFEAHDETGHFAYARYIAAEGGLPDPREKLTIWFDESHQPPLYYLLAAVAGRPFAPPEPYTPTMNPFFLRGDTLAGVNAALHDPAAESFPGTPPQQFLVVGRLLSALLSGIAVFLVFLIARALGLSDSIALTATAIAAFNPTWVFLGGAFNNDAMVAMTGPLVLWTCLRLQRRSDVGAAAVAGLALGLALMSKNNAITLAPFALVAVGLAAWRAVPGSPWRAARTVGAFVVSAGLVAGWWYARNMLAFGRPLSDRENANVILREVSPLFEIATKRNPIEFGGILLDNSFRTYWGQFGWGTIGLPDWIYLPLVVVSGLALVGLGKSLLRERRQPARWVLLGFSVMVAALPLYRAVFFNTPTLFAGRYLLPAIGAISILMAVGLFQLGRAGGALAVCSAIGLLAVSATAPAWLIGPQYRQPARLSIEEVRRDSTPVDYTYGGRARLIGYHLDRDRPLPGQEVGVTLYWQAMGTFDRPYTMGLHLMDLHTESRASINSWPGRGNFPTTLWKDGDLFADRYRLKIPLDAGAPFVGYLRPKLHEFSPSTPGGNDFQYRGDLPVTGPNGAAKEPTVGLLAIESPPSTSPEGGVEPRADFGSTLRLESLDVTAGPNPAELEVELRWRALKKPAEDLVVFVHVLDRDGRMIGQHDSEPANSLYPTNAWREGEEVVDRHSISTPSSGTGGTQTEVRLAIGVYRRVDNQRLDATSPGGAQLADRQLVIDAPLAPSPSSR